MSNNRTFFKNAQEGNMSLKDIFSDVKRKHTPEESARVFIAGTALTTPDESEMLSGWQKPFLFARFFLIFLVCMVLCLLLSFFSPGGTDALLVGTSMIIPLTMLLLAWEMNIPRTISLMEVIKIVAVGGLLSLIFTMLLLFLGIEIQDAAWAPLVEEPGKLIVIWLLLKRKNRKYVLEGVLIGMAVGTGFAIVETMNYVLNSMRQGMIIALVQLMDGWSAQGGAYYAVQQVTKLQNSTALAQTLMVDGADFGMSTAILRAFNGIVGHGVYASLYGGGLLMAKGSEPVKFQHLLKKPFLFYFGAAFLIHYLNNCGISDLFPWIIPGMLMSWSFVKTALGALFLLPLLRRGVNQVIQVTIAYHGGRVTRAVEQEAVVVHDPVQAAASPSYGTTAYLEFLSGPMAGQSFGLQEGRSITIGRHPSCQIPVNVYSVSSVHCAVVLKGSMVLITDQGSTNGTFVGSQKLMPRQEVPVPDGAMVYLGNQNCAIRIRVR